MYSEQLHRFAHENGYRWIATDHDGVVWVHTHKPVIGERVWAHVGGRTQIADNSAAFTGQTYELWRDSLEEVRLPEWKGPPKADASVPLTPYVDLLARLALAVHGGKLPIDTFEILQGIEL